MHKFSQIFKKLYQQYDNTQYKTIHDYTLIQNDFTQLYHKRRDLAHLSCNQQATINKTTTDLQIFFSSSKSICSILPFTGAVDVVLGLKVALVERYCYTLLA